MWFCVYTCIFFVFRFEIVLKPYSVNASQGSCLIVGRLYNCNVMSLFHWNFSKNIYLTKSNPKILNFFGTEMKPEQLKTNSKHLNPSRIAENLFSFVVNQIRTLLFAVRRWLGLLWFQQKVNILLGIIWDFPY